GVLLAMSLYQWQQMLMQVFLGPQTEQLRTLLLCPALRRPALATHHSACCVQMFEHVINIQHAFMLRQVLIALVPYPRGSVRQRADVLALTPVQSLGHGVELLAYLRSICNPRPGPATLRPRQHPIIPVTQVRRLAFLAFTDRQCPDLPPAIDGVHLGAIHGAFRLTRRCLELLDGAVRLLQISPGLIAAGLRGATDRLIADAHATHPPEPIAGSIKAEVTAREHHQASAPRRQMRRVQSSPLVHRDKATTATAAIVVSAGHANIAHD